MLVNDIIKRETEGLDAIYEDYIEYIIGIEGLNDLLNNGLLETCGVVNGRQLYVLCDKRE